MRSPGLTDAVDAQACETLARGYADRFLASVEIWEWPSRGPLATCCGKAPCPSERVDVAGRLAAWDPSSGPSFARIAPTLRLFLKALPAPHDHLVAVGMTDASADEFLPALLRYEGERQELAALVADQGEQIDLFAAQVSADFEEMTGLRALANQIGECTVERSLGSLAESTFNILGELLNCESLLLIYAPGKGGEFGAEPEARVWGAPVPAETCQTLVRLWGTAARKRPVVCNRQVVARLDASLAVDLRSLTMVTVQKDQSNYGWLAALNKRAPEAGAVATHLQDNHALVPHPEFGTSEATLLQSAASLLATHAKNLELWEEREDLLIGIVRTTMNSLEAKDEYTSGHSDRVAQYARIIARTLGLSRLKSKEIYVAGLVHDIGKVGVPDHVLKKRGPLTDEEFAEIKKHPEIGHKIFKDLKAFNYVLPGILYHHESVDGSGYPHGLKGDDIPLMARILAVADSFDAMTSTRPYRAGMPVRKAVKILLDGQGTQWDARCVDALLDSIDQVLAIVLDPQRRVATGSADPVASMIEDISEISATLRSMRRGASDADIPVIDFAPSPR